MAKLLNTTLLVTMSMATPEGLGYGNIYASSSKLYFTSSLGKFDLTDSSGYIIVREYTTGVSSWTRPSKAKFIRLLASGGGSGGAGGQKRTAALQTFSPGGGGGQGAHIVHVTYPIEAFTISSYTVTVGAGGNGGAGNSSLPGGTSAPGLAGGTTSLANGANVMIRATGGTFADAGSLGDNFVGTTVFPSLGGCVPNVTPYVIRTYFHGNVVNGVGKNPSTRSNENSFANFHAMNSICGNGCGGGGGGFSPAIAIGGSGSGVYVNGIPTALSPPGAAGTGANGTTGLDDVLDIMNLFFFSGSNTVTSSYGIGSGGGAGAGGNLSGTIGGGNGGDGGTIGAGGGGGGACNTGSAAGGNGGSGGDGYLAILEYY